ncbi:metal-dependent transcriptional regulator [Haladaptatus halobius]|uniref:metal-dependent transcriptional regulator n=1 Tax=Haladaptatus halobius TaxID=2884875 RepID=UPI001D09A99D|nr:metal-dependent transcriptional regulator [Haladaptatus halobius]
MNTADQYLKVIYLLQQVADEPAATGAIADALDVSPASANEMVGKLANQDLATHEKYKGVTLTDRGTERARTALETYCIIERFLVSVLDVEAFRTEANQLQSVIDETVANRLDMLVDRRSECPDCFLPEEDKCVYLDCSGND